MSEINYPPFLQDPVQPGGGSTTLSLHTANSGYPRWTLNGSSEVVLMARKLFPDHISKSVNKLSTPALRETFEDVVMLRHRFPIRLTPAATTHWNSWLEDMRRTWLEDNGLATEIEDRMKATFKGELEPFQLEGVQFLTRKKKAILADEMGLGKTVQALAAAARVGEWPVLIVAQPHVMDHWKRKFHEFMGGNLKVEILQGQGPKGARVPQADVYITHYLLLRHWRDWLTRRTFGAVIYDEVQELRGVGSEKHKAAQAVSRRAANVWGLSGTPIYNSGVEVHHIYDAMSSGILGPRKAFMDDWCTPPEDRDRLLALYDSGWRPGYVVDPKALGQYLRDKGLLLRRLEEEVKGELPRLRRVTKAIDHDQGAFAGMIKEASRLAKLAHVAVTTFEQKRLEAQALNEARQATGFAKAEATAAFVRGLVDNGQPTIVFAHHHVVVDQLQKSLSDLAPVCITGRQNRHQKTKAQLQFEQGLTDVIIIGLRAATGIDGLQKRAKSVCLQNLIGRQRYMHKARNGRTAGVRQAKSWPIIWSHVLCSTRT